MSNDVLSRQMISVNKGAEANSSGCNFSVLQWNVLADWLCDAKAFPHAHNVKALEWDMRKEAFKKILISPFGFDFVSLQEVDHWPDFFEPELRSLGLTGHFLKKQADDGSVLCWRADKFDMIDVCDFRLEERQSQVAIIGLFKHKSSEKHVVIATTHLKAKPGFEERRAQQGFRLLTKIHEIIAKANLPVSPFVIVAGDFNDTPESLVASLFRGSTVSQSGTLINPLGSLTSAYSAHPDAQSYGQSKDARYTTYKKREAEVCRTIDYIWFANAKDAHVEQLLEIPPIHQLPHRLPAEYYPSDHFSIGAAFRLV